MVQGMTHRLKASGRYLTPEEVDSNQFHHEDVEVSWEKMSKSKFNGVDPKVGCFSMPDIDNIFISIFCRKLSTSMEQILSGSSCCLE